MVRNENTQRTWIKLPPAMKLDALNAWRDYFMNVFNSNGSEQRGRADCDAEERLTNVDRLLGDSAKLVC